MWLRPTIATATDAVAAELFVTWSTSTTGAYASSTATSSVGTFGTVIVENQWNFVSMDIPAGLSATNTVVGFAVKTPATGASAEMVFLLDDIRAYNDSIVVDLGGNISTSTATATPVYLKTTGGTEKAIGYVSMTAAPKVTLIPTVLVETPVTLELISNTSNILQTDTTAVETLSLSIDLGTYLAAGDIRWYDQAVAVTTPITWLNGASPISISLGY